VFSHRLLLSVSKYYAYKLYFVERDIFGFCFQEYLDILIDESKITQLLIQRSMFIGILYFSIFFGVFSFNFNLDNFHQKIPQQSAIIVAVYSSLYGRYGSVPGPLCPSICKCGMPEAEREAA